jgi:hypothetical protein
MHTSLSLADWTVHLCDELARQLAQRVTQRPVEDGCIRVELGKYGLLVMDEDNTEALLWFLNVEGRTSGPVWQGIMTGETAATAALEVAKAVKAAPVAAAFFAWPPGRSRDADREDTVNALWAIVRERIDQVQAPLRDETDIEAAIAALESYIDELADDGHAIAEFAYPFKVEAAKAIRRRAAGGK